MARSSKVYKQELKKRADIVEWILSVTSQRSYNGMLYPFCINVKCYNVNCTFENLLTRVKALSEEPYMNNDDWIKEAHRYFEQTNSDAFWEWGLEYARSFFISQRKDGQIEHDLYTRTWTGVNLDVEYSFEGRSGGWLSINKFEGITFANRDHTPARQLLEDMPFSILRLFYQLVIMLNHDLTPDAIAAMFEEGAAFDFFINVCADIPQPDAVQKKLPFSEV